MKDKDTKRYYCKAICIDFDGVIADFTDDINVLGKIIPGAAPALRELPSSGYKIIIHTARPADKDNIARLADYLNKWEIPFDEINTNSDCPWPAQKPIADLYIDDRALRFNGNWQETLKEAKDILDVEKPFKEQIAYKGLIAKIGNRRKEAAEFENFLKTQTSWLTSPASTRYHLCKEGGLIEHSANVANTLLKLRRVLAPELSEESCVIVALYHDVGKVGMPGKPYYLPNPDKWQVRYRKIFYIINKSLTYMDIASRSLYLVSRYIPLSEEEAQAIRYHDGQYVDENKCVAHKESKLTLLLQYADNWCGEVLEKTE